FGELIKRIPEDYISTYSIRKIDNDPIKKENLITFINLILKDDQEKIDYLRKSLGYLLTGNSIDKYFLIWLNYKQNKLLYIIKLFDKCFNNLLTNNYESIKFINIQLNLNISTIKNNQQIKYIDIDYIFNDCLDVFFTWILEGVQEYNINGLVEPDFIIKIKYINKFMIKLNNINNDKNKTPEDKFIRDKIEFTNDNKLHITANEFRNEYQKYCENNDLIYKRKNIVEIFNDKLPFKQERYKNCRGWPGIKLRQNNNNAHNKYETPEDKFIEDMIEFTNDNKLYIKANDLRNVYKKYCENNNLVYRGNYVKIFEEKLQLKQKKYENYSGWPGIKFKKNNNSENDDDDIENNNEINDNNSENNDKDTSNSGDDDIENNNEINDNNSENDDEDADNDKSEYEIIENDENNEDTTNSNDKDEYEIIEIDEDEYYDKNEYEIIEVDEEEYNNYIQIIKEKYNKNDENTQNNNDNNIKCEKGEKEKLICEKYNVISSKENINLLTQKLNNRVSSYLHRDKKRFSKYVNMEEAKKLTEHTIQNGFKKIFNFKLPKIVQKLRKKLIKDLNIKELDIITKYILTTNKPIKLYRNKKDNKLLLLEKPTINTANYDDLCDLLLTYEPNCFYCKKEINLLNETYNKTNLSFDAKIPILGHTKTNLCVCCINCNSKKKDNNTL
ncbi:MAG: hypothetical protein KIT69_14145, partial [Propionibacteriaceae bacterium]|nr:hypothetical protein [Propionibacteriaceae bacterium]